MMKRKASISVYKQILDTHLRKDHLNIDKGNLTILKVSQIVNSNLNAGRNKEELLICNSILVIPILIVRDLINWKYPGRRKRFQSLKLGAIMDLQIFWDYWKLVWKLALKAIPRTREMAQWLGPLPAILEDLSLFTSIHIPHKHLYSRSKFYVLFLASMGTHTQVVYLSSIKINLKNVTSIGYHSKISETEAWNVVLSNTDVKMYASKYVNSIDRSYKETMAS